MKCTLCSLFKEERIMPFLKPFGEEVEAMRHHKSCIFFLVITIFLSIELTQVSEAVLDKFYVRVINNFNNETIGVHCWSKDNDLGKTFLSVGQNFQWHFRSNFFGTTRFTCHLWRSQSYATFAVFWDDNKFIRNKCGDGICRWIARPDGIYTYMYVDNQYERQYSWKEWHEKKKSTFYAYLSIKWSLICSYPNFLKPLNVILTRLLSTIYYLTLQYLMSRST